MFRNLFATAFLIFLFSNIIAQQTAIFTNDLESYNKAVELYENQQYLAAQTMFSRVKSEVTDETIRGDCAYYIANCAVRLNQQNADALMETFVQDYPTSIKRNEAYLNVANFYFENGRYAYARKWFDKVDESGLSRAEKEKFYFNNGYAYFSSKRFSEAKKYFNRVSDSQTYGSQAKYYLGFIAYEGDDYESATDLFEQVQGEERYAEGLSYYQADMNFKLGKFQEAIDMGLEQYDNANPRERSELSKIIGESYFNLGQYEQAIPYLSEYKGKRGKWNNTDYYQLGYAYYKQGSYQEAIDEFNKIIDGNNSVAQNAYYHLAESYLRLDQKQQALSAFRNASEMDFSEEIREDAWLNYAKLSYEIGNSFEPVTRVLLSFIETFPGNRNNTELRELLIDSYISARNYEEALKILEGNKSFENKVAYQKVAFLRGVELYNEGNYSEAATLFDKSLSEARDPLYTARATFWKAECDYQRSDFDESLIGYLQFRQLPNASATTEYTNLAYNMAYNYFKLKNYPEAINNFKGYLESSTSDAARIQDSHLRLGDSYFVSSQYWPAMESYNRAIELGTPDEDYAAFQKAISYGFVDRVQNKLENLKDFRSKYRGSIYNDDALYELGNTHLSLDQNEEAVEAYNELIAGYPKSIYLPKAQLKKALIFDNSNRSNDALRIFKKVASDYPGSDEALQAVSSAKLIYIDQGRVSDYADWVRTLDYVEVADSELDDAAYRAAEQPYLANKLKQAEDRFEEYLEQFPNGRHRLRANFYRAQILFGSENEFEAIPHYLFVVSRETNEFTEQALARISELYLKQKDYENALSFLKRLEEEADFPQNVIFARTNAMKASYELKKYEEAVSFAEAVLRNNKVDNSIRSDARLIIARSAIETADMERAKSAYKALRESATGKLAAEALYYEAYFKNSESDYQGSNESIQELARDYPGYKYFGAKGLLLMSRNFYALEDAYQATYILESLIENFSEYSEIIQEAEADLAAIKSKEAKTNASVETDEN